MDGRVPARLVHDQVEVVLGRQARGAIPAPSQFGRLALQRAHGHRVELGVNAFGQVPVEIAQVATHHLVGDNCERVAGVQCERGAVRARQRGFTAALLTAVGNVVVDEKRVVQQLDAHRQRHRVRRRSPKAATRRQAEGGTDRLAAAHRVVAHRSVQPVERFAVRDRVDHGPANGLACGAQDRVDRSDGGVVVCRDRHGTRISIGSHWSANPSTSSNAR